MAFFEKTEYWGLKDPLEVRVQHGTCIYMGDTFSSHFEPKKFNRVGRRGQKQPKWGYFGTFWEGQNMAHLGHINGDEFVLMYSERIKWSPWSRLLLKEIFRYFMKYLSILHGTFLLEV